MSLPGLSQFPDLEAQYLQKLGMLNRKAGCTSCERRKLTEKYRTLMERRLKRDKRP